MSHHGISQNRMVSQHRMMTRQGWCHSMVWCHSTRWCHSTGRCHSKGCDNKDDDTAQDDVTEWDVCHPVPERVSRGEAWAFLFRLWDLASWRVTTILQEAGPCSSTFLPPLSFLLLSTVFTADFPVLYAIIFLAHHSWKKQNKRIDNRKGMCAFSNGLWGKNTHGRWFSFFSYFFILKIKSNKINFLKTKIQL